MRHKLLLLFLFFSVLGLGQVPVTTPEEYETQKVYWQNFVNIQEGLYDVTIPVEERIMFLPNMLSMASGNWGADWHGAVRNTEAIKKGGARKVAVFVFDTGAGFSNDRLKQAWWQGMERQYTGDGTKIDVQSHSTHVSGIIGAVDPGGTPLGIGAELVKKDLLKIIPYEVLNDQGSGLFTWIANATKDANEMAKKLIKEGWFVIYNYSLGSPSQSALVDIQLREAEKTGVLVVAAAGNTGREGVQYPGSSVYSHAVAALEQKDNTVQRASFSTYGRQVAFAASGRRVLSTIPNNGLAEYSGTSMAAPTIAGLAAVWASTHPDMTAKDVLAAMEQKGFDIAPAGKDMYTGSGSPMLDSLFLAPSPPDDEPDKPVEEPPTIKERTITVHFDKAYSVMWKGAMGGQFKDMDVVLTAKYKTDLYSLDAITALRDKTDGFFERRVFIVANDDFLEAAYYVRYFYELLLKQDGFEVEISEIQAEHQGRRGEPQDKRRIGNKRLVNTFQYGDIESLSYLRQYNVKKGKQNFSPNESLWPVYRPKGFQLTAVLDSSCWYSQEDWTTDLDRDWYDWNKLKGVTNYFTANNHTSALIAWRPDEKENHFQIAAYTNFPKTNWIVGEPVIVKAGQEFSAEGMISRRKVNYTIQDQKTEHPFARRIWFGRETGTWIGGANNSEGPFGGEASQDMKMWIDFEIL